MPVNGFLVDNTVQKYNYESLENYNTPDFSTSSTYQVGDYVMYQGKLYKCTTAITTSGAWDSTKWSLAILSDDVADLKSALDEVLGQANFATGYRLNKNDGTLVADSSFCVSDYIPVTAGQLMFYYGEYSSSIYLIEYDATKAYNTYWGAQSGAESRNIPALYEQDTAYVRFAFNKGYVGKLTRGNNVLWQAGYHDGLADDVADLQSDVVGLQSDVTSIESFDSNVRNMFSSESIEDFTWIDNSYVTTSGVITSYNGWHRTDYIEIDKNNPLKLYSTASGSSQTYNCFYDSSKNFISNFLVNKDTTTYTAPDNAAYFILSTQTTNDIKHGVFSFNTESAAKVLGVPPVKVQAYTFRGNIASGETKDTENSFAPKIGFKCGLYAEFSGTFDKITLQFDAYSPNQIIVDGEKVYFKSRFIGDSNQAHGITISGNVFINAYVDDPAKIKVTISSNGAQATIEKPFSITAYETFKIVNGTQALSNVVFTMGCGTINHPIWVIGDSYLGMTDDNRWPYYIYQNGFTKNSMFCGSTGSGHTEYALWFNSLIKYGTPKMILWCMGMNYATDGSTSPSAQWKTDTDMLMTFCEQNKIELVLATIPSIPNKSHEQKNAYVRSSGYRYIDFARAVGAQSDGTWIEGMLASDEVHPTTSGAVALYNMAISSVPELTFDYV